MGCYNQYEARVCSYTECKSSHMLHTLALWGLVTNYGEGGGLQNGRGGGKVKFYPYKKGRAVLDVLKGGGAQTVLR